VVVPFFLISLTSFSFWLENAFIFLLVYVARGNLNFKHILLFFEFTGLLALEVSKASNLLTPLCLAFIARVRTSDKKLYIDALI